LVDAILTPTREPSLLSSQVQQGPGHPQLIGRHPFDLILCDWRMPEMDGRALYDQIRRDHPQALKRIPFVTAQAQGLDYGPFLRDTGAPVLEKPFTIHQLRHIVERMVGRGRYARR